MTRPNVRLADTGVVHAHARSARQILRCGARFVRHEQERRPVDARPQGSDTEDPIDCMVCLVRDEFACADIQEILIENSVKDLQESMDALAVQFVNDCVHEWENRKGRR